MKLQVGIADGHQGWEYLFRQEGVPFSCVNDLPDSGEFVVLAAGDQTQPTQAKFLQGFLRQGGGVLCSMRAYAAMTRQQHTGAYLRFLDGTNDPVFGDVGVFDIRFGCQVISGANALRSGNGEFTAFVGTYENGPIVVLPFDPAEVILDQATATKSFFSDSDRLPFEEVAKVEKRGILRTVAAALRYLFARRSVPYCHLWYHPHTERSLFAFRVDSDHGQRGQVEELDRLSREFQVPFTWFVDVQSQQHHFDAFKKLNGNEVGVHCYSHRRYEGQVDCEKDLRTALMVFELSGLDPAGVALPYGQWTAWLGDAIRACRFDYSSEFGYDYDSLPSYPLLAGGWSPVLQIPLHPISIGSLRRQGYSETEMKRYFMRLIDARLAGRDPIILLHHPKDGHLDVVRSVLDRVRQTGLRTMRMGEYAKWWKRRTTSIPTITLEQNVLRLGLRSVAEDVTVRIVSPEGREAFASLAPGISLDNLVWESVPAGLPVPDGFLRSKDFNYRIPLTKGIDTVFGFFQRIKERAVS